MLVVTGPALASLIIPPFEPQAAAISLGTSKPALVALVLPKALENLAALTLPRAEVAIEAAPSVGPVAAFKRFGVSLLRGLKDIAAAGIDALLNFTPVLKVFRALRDIVRAGKSLVNELSAAPAV